MACSLARLAVVSAVSAPERSAATRRSATMPASAKIAGASAKECMLVPIRWRMAA